MSRENVERAHRAFEAVNRRDFEAFRALMDPKVEFNTRFIKMEGGPQYRGHNGIHEWWADLLGIFPDLSLEVLEVRDLGALAIGAVRIRGHGADRGVPFEDKVWGDERVA